MRLSPQHSRTAGESWEVFVRWPTSRQAATELASRRKSHELSRFLKVHALLSHILPTDSYTEVLYDHGLTLSHSVFMSIFVSSMDLFARMNSVYASYFGISPPARACVAVDLPPGINIRLECIAFSHNIPPHRESLHVQGLSYWAPANIGPYSQAIKVQSLSVLKHNKRLTSDRRQRNICSFQARLG